ncbi:MAG: divalent-cation tolerance protein CutA [Aureliella sp.]
MFDLIEVTTTCACQETARQLARQLVDQRLVACVQINGPIESVYRWEGQVRFEQEWVCRAKSLAPLAPRIIEFIAAQHAYEVPEILVQPVADCSPSYASWVRAEVAAEA